MTPTESIYVAEKLRECLRLLDPAQEMTVGELSALVGRSNKSVSRSLHRASCPKTDWLCGESGRILAVKVTAALLDYLKPRR